MTYCSNCGRQIENETLFCPKCGKRVGIVINVQQLYSQAFQQQEQRPSKPNSNMAFAIVTTCMCCVPLGIYAIILANKVDNLYDLGEYKQAEMVAQDAKKWSIIGMVGGFLIQIISLILIILAAIFEE